MTRNPIYRQGDVLIRRVDCVPEGAKPVAREGGRVILAHGEVTGHAHALVEEGAQLFATIGGKHYLRLDTDAVVRHEEHTAIPLEAGTYEVVRQREYHPTEIRNVAD